MRAKFLIVLVVVLLASLTMAPLNAQDGKAITVSWLQEPDSLNPMYSTMTFAEYTYQLYLAPAWTLDQDLNPVPVLVEEIPSADNGGISEDGTTFTLTLKGGLVWSDGDPLDSADFLFTHEMVTSDQNAPFSTSPWDRIASIEAPDALTVVITFEEPYAPWLGLFDFVLPEHVLRPVFEAEGTLDGAAFNRSPTVASGAYVVDEWDTGNFIRFSRNENFVGGVANIDTIIVTFVPDDNTYVANLLSGDADLGTFVPPSEVASLEGAGLTVEIIPSGYNETWFINVDEELAHPALQDVRVRQALALGFDRATVIADLLDGVLPPASGYWHNTPFDNPDVGALEYDPEAAAALLDEAGWVDSDGDGIRDKDGVDLSLRFVATTRQLRRDIQAVAQQQFAEIGVGIQIENYDADIFFASYAEGGITATGQYDIAEWSSSPGSFPDPDSANWLCDEIPTEEDPTGDNQNFYCDPELDALFVAQQSATDLDQRIELFHQIDQKIRDAYILLPMWHDADIWVIGSRLSNVHLNGVAPFWDVVNWDVVE